MQPTLFLVDRSAAFARSVSRFLAASGGRLCGAASDGDSALPLVAAMRPHIVLVEWRAHDSGRHRLLRALAEAPWPVRVVALTLEEIPPAERASFAGAEVVPKARLAEWLARLSGEGAAP